MKIERIIEAVLGTGITLAAPELIIGELMVLDAFKVL